jgi:signal transduction histidine kinase
VTLHRPVETDDSARLRQAIATAAHEIRNPVTVLTGIAVMLGEAGVPSSQEQLANLLGAVARQAALLDRVTEDLLTAAQTQRGTLRLETGSWEVVPLLVDAVHDLGEGVTVDVRGGEGLLVRADPTRLGQMVANLLSNALKYGAPPYAIEVTRSTGWTGPLVHVSVEDCGPGVPEEFREQLFEEFSRARDAGTRGTGLGLFLVRSLAQAQDGGADYRPRPGGGSVFTITLPEG